MSFSSRTARHRVSSAIFCRAKIVRASATFILPVVQG